LYKSPHLGVAIADEGRIVDANDALLRMIKRTRDELIRGEIDWHDMTPEEYRLLDNNGVEQLRNYGTCVPFEKEFMLPDGSRLPFLIGAVRLNEQPLQWSAFICDLTEQSNLRAAERKLRDWESRYQIINRLAHEINNPLAALMFTLHLLGTHSDVGADARDLVADADTMLRRVAAVVKQVLEESSAAEKSLP
jgi:PAS domain S-box-containing protein